MNTNRAITSAATNAFSSLITSNNMIYFAKTNNLTNPPDLFIVLTHHHLNPPSATDNRSEVPALD